jgi:hypothetical protein
MAGIQQRSSLNQRPPQIGSEREPQIARHHADDRGRLAIHLDGLPKDVRVLVESILVTGAARSFSSLNVKSRPITGLYPIRENVLAVICERL